MGKGGGGSGEGTIRYAPYLELAHGRLLDNEGSVLPAKSMMEVLNAAFDQSPYASYETLDVDEGFFGIREDDPNSTYEIKNFPALWDMFGKFIGGLDVHDLWAQVYEDVVHGPEIENAVSAQSEVLQADVETNVMPRFLAGMRDINAVQSSTFVVGKAIIQAGVVRGINEFQSKLRISAVELSATMWAKHLDWSRGVPMNYAEIIKLYYSAKMDMDKTQLEYEVKDTLWNLGLFDNARATLGAMNGAAAAKSGNEPSGVQKALGGALSGAAAGAMVGGPVGAAIGGTLGILGGLF